MKKGFTLIELLVVIAIISLLSSIVLASLGQARVKARDSKRVQDIIQLRTALELYAADNGGLYPPSPIVSGPFVSYGSSCWDCNPVTWGSFYDGNKLGTALSFYLDPRPFDPFLSSGNDKFTATPDAFGYWYKVSASRRDYKIAILGTLENTGNIPNSMIDDDFDSQPGPPFSVSLYTPNAQYWIWFTNISSL